MSSLRRWKSKLRIWYFQLVLSPCFRELGDHLTNCFCHCCIPHDRTSMSLSAKPSEKLSTNHPDSVKLLCDAYCCLFTNLVNLSCSLISFIDLLALFTFSQLSPIKTYTHPLWLRYEEGNTYYCRFCKSSSFLEWKSQPVTPFIPICQAPEYYCSTTKTVAKHSEKPVITFIFLVKGHYVRVLRFCDSMSSLCGPLCPLFCLTCPHYWSLTQ